MDVRRILTNMQSGAISIDEAQEQLKNLPYEDLGFAKLDHHRSLRSGFCEVVFCQGKTPQQTATIFEHLYKADKSVLGTRASREVFEAVCAVIPQTEYDEQSRIVSVGQGQPDKKGCVAVATGGTSDLPVAEEAARTAEFFGARVERYFDVGVAGIHRLFDCIEDIRRANVVIAVAGMEGALPGVLAGLLDRPVIAVPTSIGYGANFGGLSALLTMLNSCAEGIGVVNIDNGFGAGYLATQINNLAVGG